MAKYELMYFNGRGRAELTRVAFAIAGVEYEDTRVTDWPALKPSTPFGFMPVLKVGGGPTLTESLVVAQYVAEEHGFGGKDAAQRAQVRMVLSHLNDYMTEFFKVAFEKDDTKKAELSKKLKEENLPKTFGNIEKLHKANKDGSGFMFGDSLTTADLKVWLLVADMKMLEGVDGFDTLKALAKRVAENPKVAAWVAKRPESPF